MEVFEDDLGSPAGAPAPDQDDPMHPWKTILCLHCGFPWRVKVSCGSRVCPVCRRKWFGYHFKALYDLVSTWKQTRSLTLTTRNIPDAEFSREDVLRIRRHFSQLRAHFKKQIAGGFYVVQATNRGHGWHLHLHIIYDGEFIYQGDVSAAWSRITGGSYVVDIRTVKKPEKAIRYLLADFSGAPRIRTEDADTYDRVFKGSRLVQPFGIYLKYKFRVPFKCPQCGCTEWIPIEELDRARLEQWTRKIGDRCVRCALQPAALEGGP